MMMDYHRMKVDEIMMPELRSISRVCCHMRCVEWNGAGGGYVEAAKMFGAEVQFLAARHGRIINQFRERYDYTPYDGGGIDLLGGSSKTEADVAQFRQVVRSYKPKTAALATPLVGMEDGNAIASPPLTVLRLEI